MDEISRWAVLSLDVNRNVLGHSLCEGGFAAIATKEFPRVAGLAWFADHSLSNRAAGLVPRMQFSIWRTGLKRALQRTQRGSADHESKFEAVESRGCTVPSGARPALALCVLLLTGCGGPATTAADWINQQAARNAVPPPAPFSPVPAMTLDRARSTGDCNVDKIDGQTAQGMAVDHLGGAMFTGWAGDHLTHTVPTGVEVILTGATGDYWASGDAGHARKDVAAAQKVAAYATSGFDVDASMYRVPIGAYGVSLAYRVGGEWVKCPTSVRISVE